MTESDEFYASLSKKAVSAAALIFNKKSELLIVKPGYKDHWSLPGGISEAGESPWLTCLREAKEECNAAIACKKQLLCAAHVMYEGHEWMQFIFYGGVISGKKLKELKADGREILDIKFIDIREIGKYLSAGTAQRARASLRVLKDGKTAIVG